jgi:hypothetical protein
MRRLYRDRPINAAITAGWGRQGIEVVTAQAMGTPRRRIRALLERGTASSGCGAVTMTIAGPWSGHV